MSATDARRTEMELKVEQKILCDVIEGQDDMQARMEKNLQDWSTNYQAEFMVNLGKMNEAHAGTVRQLEEALQKNLKLEHEKSTLTAKYKALTDKYADAVLFAAEEQRKRALAAAKAAVLNSRP